MRFNHLSIPLFLFTVVGFLMGPNCDSTSNSSVKNSSNNAQNADEQEDLCLDGLAKIAQGAASLDTKSIPKACPTHTGGTMISKSVDLSSGGNSAYAGLILGNESVNLKAGVT